MKLKRSPNRKKNSDDIKKEGKGSVGSFDLTDSATNPKNPAVDLDINNWQGASCSR
ncbi:MAG: hypothetical protein U5K27_12440 [Desulfotignum sp.]|nr:hypothetical protein [Desulfotignum sp.]